MNKRNKLTYRPGEIAEDSGQYAIINKLGKRTGVERTVVEGEPLPPTLEKGQKFRLTDKTKTS